MLDKMPTVKFTTTFYQLFYLGILMTDVNKQNDGDGKADAMAAIAVVLIVVTGVIYWLTSV